MEDLHTNLVIKNLLQTIANLNLTIAVLQSHNAQLEAKLKHCNVEELNHD